MTYEDILINTKQIINNYLEREKIEESNYLERDLNIDSISFIGIIADIEEKFGQIIDIEDLLKNGDITVSEFINYIAKKIVLSSEFFYHISAKRNNE